MNQFRSLFLNKTYPGHPFHDLKRAANSQKCVRLSGKHNDLKDVGVDLYHHTFFEMLGNWSFGDYSKADACKMAWELLTNVYGLKSENLYVTYFGGDKCLEVPPDEECRKIWLEIGVNPNHIFPFGAKDNFWEMADKGPCGPCTEIHYDFLNSSPEIVAQKINTDTHDVMEIWNLVFVQYNREKENILKSIPTLNVDTGMGLERLTAVLQGTRSNYDTDLFTPLFEAIESNFKVRPYLGKTGIDDTDSLDTAYRILADHSRMFSVAIADGVFPDTYDTGHVLRKIIRRAAYTANRVMKTRPGALSSLVPYVAKTLDFYPEIDKHIDEIIYIVNDEEKAFHHAINRGRKARNKMISDSPYRILTGQQTYPQNFWLQQAYSQHEEKSSEVSKLINDLTKKNIPLSDDSFKYCYNTEKNIFGVKSISANILAIFFEKEMVPEAKEGAQCILVLDKTNFYSEAGGQISDVGNIYNKDFNFHVDNVTSSQGYIFHHGRVTKGKMTSNAVINLDVDQKHRLSCSQNHTATHILNAALRKILPYTAQRSSHAGPSHLKYTFSAKESLTDQQLEIIEVYANDMIQKKLDVFRNEVPFEELLTFNKPIYAWLNIIDSFNLDYEAVKALIKECQTKYDAPLRDLKKSEAILTDLKLQLNDFINASSRTDMNLDASGMLNQEHKVHPQVLKDLKAKKIPPTNDTFKYEYWDKGVKSISARVAAVIRENQLVDCVERGLNCQLVLDKTNFYAEGNDQACDEGIITCEGSISDDQLRIIEKNVQESIQAKLDVSQSKMPVESLKEVPPCKAALIKKNTKNKERVIRAVTGKQALAVERDGQIYDKDLSELEERRDVLELWDCLREVKEAKVYHETELPLLLFREHQAKLTELTKQLTKATDDFVQNGFREVKDEIEDVLKKFSDKKFIIYHLSSIGDGKKIINYAIEKSTEKPALYFAKDGHKSVVCSCSVPKSLVSSSFSALLWINPVASVLEGQARTLFKDPELFYSVISKRIDKIDEAATVAKDFVESHLSNK
ncbi:Alanine--tRNA ligase like protein [Argiope bruennichi]|uniref:alanine--tRNA ligase n=1 Tax=Argiope bruennichi TaxID=94029 RepID=A0A8T0E345_ARGBR|nr:Alanine--tRNA ligase like protein [Argiope bruennichi]